MKRIFFPLLLAILVAFGLLASSPTRATENTGQGYGYGYPETDLGIIPIGIAVEPRVYLKDFADQHELAVWMSTAPWVFPDWTIPRFKCNHFARAFQKFAEADGYRLNVTKVETDDPKKPHMLNAAVVGDNEWWLIEPQNHTYWFDCYLDPPVSD